MTAERLLLLGLDHTDYGRVHSAPQAAGRTAAAISVGGPYVEIRKGDLDVPNEDGALAIDDGDRTLLVVADGHHGHWASHGLLEALAEIPVPTDLMALLATIQRLAQPLPTDRTSLPPGLLDARSTLLAAVVDRRHHRTFGASYGDSSIFGVANDRFPERFNRKSEHYVSPWSPGSLDPRHAREFSFAVAPGDLVVVCTDGIDECHYGQPSTSVGPEHFARVFTEAQQPHAFARKLAELALLGVDGHPGGQDNLALAVARA
jgi:serine/threonine protein phosphatase PrpC